MSVYLCLCLCVLYLVWGVCVCVCVCVCVVCCVLCVVLCVCVCVDCVLSIDEEVCRHGTAKSRPWQDSNLQSLVILRSMRAQWAPIVECSPTPFPFGHRISAFFGAMCFWLLHLRHHPFSPTFVPRSMSLSQCSRAGGLWCRGLGCGIANHC